MKHFLSLFIGCFFCSMSIYAQTERETQKPAEMPVLHFKSSRLYGKLIDPASGKGMEGASVQLYLRATDSLVGGMLTRGNGDFSFRNLLSGTSYKVAISALGFENYEQIIQTDALKENDNATFEEKKKKRGGGGGGGPRQY